MDAAEFNQNEILVENSQEDGDDVFTAAQNKPSRENFSIKDSEFDPNGFESAYFEPKIKEMSAIIDSLLSTTEKQANIISHQYDALANINKQVLVAMEQNNESVRSLISACIGLPEIIKDMSADLEEFYKSFAKTDDQINFAHDRFKLMFERLGELNKIGTSISKDISNARSAGGYTEQTPGSFEPGGRGRY
jgi:DNA repair ATPase RecN